MALDCLVLYITNIWQSCVGPGSVHLAAIETHTHTHKIKAIICLRAILFKIYLTSPWKTKYKCELRMLTWENLKKEKKKKNVDMKKIESFSVS